jgi:hypothetical protein
MLRGVRHVFRRMGGEEFDQYFASLVTHGRSGVPTADEARKDYARACRPHRDLI